MSATRHTQAEITESLMAVIAWAGNTAAAAEYLEAEKGITVSRYTLANWRRKHAAEYLELREKFAEQQEKQLAGEYLDLAAQAGQGARLAVEKAVKRLEAGEDDDPGRTAANLIRVSQSSVEKHHLLENRPSRITETRGVEEIVRGLIARVPGLIQLAEETGADHDDSASPAD